MQKAIYSRKPQSWLTLAPVPDSVKAPEYGVHNMGADKPGYAVTAYGVVFRLGELSSVRDYVTANGLQHKGVLVFPGVACLRERRMISTDSVQCVPDPVRNKAAIQAARDAEDMAAGEVFTPRPAAPVPRADTLKPIQAATPVIQAATPGAAPAAPPHQSDRFAAQMKSAGLSVVLPSTWFPNGTELIGYGKDQARRRAAAHAALPALSVALPRFRQRVAVEDRVYSDVPASRLAVEAGGILTWKEGRHNRAAALEPRSLAALIGRFPRAFPGGIAPWRSLLQDDGAHFADVATRRLRALGDYGYEDRLQRLRVGTRKGAALAGGLTRSVFVLGSDMFMPLDPAEFLAELATAAPDGARVDLSYDPDTTVTRWYVSMHASAESMIKSGVGAVFEAGIRGMTADNGTSNLRSGGVFRRIRCVNLTVVSGSIDGELAMVHRGSRAGWRSQIRRALAQVRQAGAAQASDLAVIGTAFGESWASAESTVLGSRGVLAGELRGIKTLLASGPKAGRIEVPDQVLAAAWGATRGEDPARSSITVADVANVATWAGSHGLLDELNRWKVQTQAADLLSRDRVELLIKSASDPRVWAAR